MTEQSHEHAWGRAEVIGGPSHVGRRYDVCVLCLYLKPSGDDLEANFVEAVRALPLAHADVQTCADALRKAGYSWTKIGALIGVSRQAAWERFGSRPGRAGRQPRATTDRSQ